MQIGTAYLLCPEAKISSAYREALKNTTETQTTLTNILTGRPIRELGPMSDSVPGFPLAAAALRPLRSKAEAAGSSDFTPLWSGQAAHLARELPAAELTKRLAAEALEILRTLTVSDSVIPATDIAADLRYVRC